MGRKKSRKNRGKLTLKILISIGAIAVAIAHLIWPNLTIDAITVFLIAISIVPWLDQLFKSIELPGGLKIEYHELEKVREKIEKEGLLDSKIPRGGGGPFLGFESVSIDDPNLVFAAFRIEIEKRLRWIGESFNLDIERSSSKQLISLLRKKGVLTNNEVTVLHELNSLLIKAIHGATLDPNAVGWVYDIGPKFLGVLQEKEKGFLGNNR